MTTSDNVVLLISWFPKPPSKKSYLITMKRIMHYLFRPLEGSSVCNHIHIKEELSLQKGIWGWKGRNHVIWGQKI